MNHTMKRNENDEKSVPKIKRIADENLDGKQLSLAVFCKIQSQ